MRVDKPSPEVVCAVEGAISWLNQARITVLRVTSQRDKTV